MIYTHSTHTHVLESIVMFIFVSSLSLALAMNKWSSSSHTRARRQTVSISLRCQFDSISFIASNGFIASCIITPTHSSLLFRQRIHSSLSDNWLHENPAEKKDDDDDDVGCSFQSFKLQIVPFQRTNFHILYLRRVFAIWFGQHCQPSCRSHCLILLFGECVWRPIRMKNSRKISLFGSLIFILEETPIRIAYAERQALTLAHEK